MDISDDTGRLKLSNSVKGNAEFSATLSVVRKDPTSSLRKDQVTANKSDADSL